MEILGEFVLSDSADFVSFCCSRGIGKIWAEEFFARSLRKENSEGLDEIEKLCSSKIRKQREELVHLDNREKIVSRIINGVERRDGSIRYYNYFDLLMDEGRVVPFKELKQEMLNNYPEFAKDSFSRSCANQVFSRYEESRQIGVLPVAYSFSSSFADCVLKNDLLVSINKSETHFVTQEEKLVALDFIRAKGFPEFVYYDAIVSYVSGEYNFKELLSKEQGNKVLVKTDSNNN